MSIKGWFKFVVITFVLMCTFGYVFIDKTQCISKAGLFIDMVNATVLLYDDSGHSSGVFIDDNVILTAGHCLRFRNGKAINIELADGTVLSSNNFYVDDEHDLGLVFVDAEEPTMADISKDAGSLGDIIYLVGMPYAREYKFSLFSGVISKVSRYLPGVESPNLIQVDADSGPGNSGGPLYNKSGKLIGIYVRQANGGGLSISFCEPVGNILKTYETTRK